MTRRHVDRRARCHLHDAEDREHQNSLGQEADEEGDDYYDDEEDEEPWDDEDEDY